LSVLFQFLQQVLIRGLSNNTAELGPVIVDQAYAFNGDIIDKPVILLLVEAVVDRNVNILPGNDFDFDNAIFTSILPV
jgi:hypothetical protein